jgi:hypothetical protein
MKFKKHGSFLVPEGTELEDLGGKAQRLVQYQDLARKHGFHFPDAVALPWQTFADVAKRKGVKLDSGLTFDNYPEFKAEEFSDVEKAIVQGVVSRIDFPFFSSSAPGEDSFKARMPGAYNSEEGFMKKWIQSDRDEGIGKLEISMEEEHVYHSCNKIGKVLASYFYPFPTGLRKKHGIDDTGMGILAREVVGGEPGPRFSLVIQTNKPDGICVGIYAGYGEYLVSGERGDLFKYDPEKKSFNEDPKKYPFLEKIIQMVLAFEKDLNLPEDFGGDYELALDHDMNVHLLQCPPIKKVEDVGDVPEKGNLLSGVETPTACVDLDFDKIVYIPRGFGPNKTIMQELFDLNQRLSNYVLVTGAIPEVYTSEMTYNAGGIIEAYYTKHDGKRLRARDRETIDHYTTLLRAEKIGFVTAKVSDEIDDRFFGGDEPIGMNVIDVKGKFKVNELRGQAGLYLEK